MEHRPPMFVIVSVPGCTFNLDEFSHAYPSIVNQRHLKIEFKKGGHIVIDDFSLDDFNKALRDASPPSELSAPE